MKLASSRIFQFYFKIVDTFTCTRLVLLTSKFMKGNKMNLKSCTGNNFKSSVGNNFWSKPYLPHFVENPCYSKVVVIREQIGGSQKLTHKILHIIRFDCSPNCCVDFKLKEFCIKCSKLATANHAFFTLSQETKRTFLHVYNFIVGSGGTPGTRWPRPHPRFLFSCSFWEKLTRTIGWCPHLVVGVTPLGNP